MIKRFIGTAFVMLFFCFAILAQTGTNRLNPKELNLTWEVVEEGYQNKSQTLSAITLTNTGKNALPATGWSLYFHASPSFKSKESNAPVKIEHVNGDLLRMVPTSSFSSLPAGASRRIELVSAGQHTRKEHLQLREFRSDKR